MHPSGISARDNLGVPLRRNEHKRSMNTEDLGVNIRQRQKASDFHWQPGSIISAPTQGRVLMTLDIGD